MEAGRLKVQSGLHGEFKATQSYIVRSCLKNPKKKKEKEKSRNSNEH
jgi:hypothetical protein